MFSNIEHIFSANLSVSKIRLLGLISRSSQHSGLTLLVFCIFIKRCYACSN